MRRAGCGCVAVPIVLILLLIAGGGVVWLVNNIDTANSSESVEGRIVALRESSGSDGDPTYVPVVEYQVGGVAYRAESPVSYGGVLVPDIGETRTVYYDLANPADATVRDTATFWVIPIALIVVPTLIAAGVIMGAVATSRRRPRSEEETAVMPGSDDAAPRTDPTALVRSSGVTAVEADFMGVEVSPMDDAGKMRFRVRAKAEIDDEMRRFHSEWLDEDPTLRLMDAGNRVTVLIDPANPQWSEVVLPTEE